MKQDEANHLQFIEPMMATRVDQLPSGNWIYELKFDGYRAIAVKSDKQVRPPRGDKSAQCR